VSGVNYFFPSTTIRIPGWLIDSGRACGNCEKAGAFLRRLFQAAVEIINKKMPQATLLISTAAAVSTGLPFLSFLVLFSFFPGHGVGLWKTIRARIVYRRRSVLGTTRSMADCLQWMMSVHCGS
jgi:hypothetical protein